MKIKIWKNFGTLLKTWSSSSQTLLKNKMETLSKSFDIAYSLNIGILCKLKRHYVLFFHYSHVNGTIGGIVNESKTL
jgi:hypothetical protein